MTTKGRTIRLFLVDGTPTGLLTAEVINWTGHVTMAKRSRLPDLIQREEAKRTGIYFLTGSDPENPGRSIVYIGESDNVGKRLAHHNKDEGKDYWDTACIVTSKDQNITKAHARYLEARMIAITKSVNRAGLDNTTSPAPPALPESDQSDMEGFIEQVRLVLPVLGLDFLRAMPIVSQGPKADRDIATIDESPVFEIVSKRHGLKARAAEIDGEFIVLKGSMARGGWIGKGSEDSTYGRLHRRLVKEGKLAVQEGSDNRVFAEDVPFASPSAASASVFGRPSNGRFEWKVTGTKKSYADWQQEQVEAAGTEGKSHS